MRSRKPWTSQKNGGPLGPARYTLCSEWVLKLVHLVLGAVRFLLDLVFGLVGLALGLVFGLVALLLGLVAAVALEGGELAVGQRAVAVLVELVEVRGQAVVGLDLV